MPAACPGVSLHRGTWRAQLVNKLVGAFVVSNRGFWPESVSTNYVRTGIFTYGARTIDITWPAAGRKPRHGAVRT